jgi:hypothetical protein
MYTEWTADIIDEALSQLSSQGRNVIDLHLQFPKGLPMKYLKALGIDEERFQMALETALSYARERLASLGIRALGDLPFHEPARTFEGRLNVKAKFAEKLARKKSPGQGLKDRQTQSIHVTFC